VIGDDGPGVFVRPGVAEAIAAELIPAAGIVTPNRFELAHLAGQPVEGLSDALAAAALLRTRGPQLVVATGLPLDGPDGDRLGVLAAATADAWLVATPRLPRPFAGTGDAFSALLLGHLLRDPALPAALERAVSALYALVETTSRLDLAELALVEAQDAFAGGEVRFRAERVS
jgi:pyridoxine kinase